jgi:hypothetical protein
MLEFDLDTACLEEVIIKRFWGLKDAMWRQIEKIINI